MSALNIMKKEKTYHFTLTLKGVSEPSEEIENALFEAKCEDALLYFRNQIGYLEFERVSENIESAIISAINDVESAGVNVKIARVEPADLVTSAEISRRLNRSRESIRLLIKGARGSGDFPIPIAGVSSKTLIWSWTEVSKWFHSNDKIEDPYIVKQAQVIKEINEALEMRNESYSFKKINFFISKINDKKSLPKAVYPIKRPLERAVPNVIRNRLYAGYAVFRHHLVNSTSENS
jgi:hypothetical protein